MKRVLVCGAGGFIGGHLVTALKKRGYWVRGVDIKQHEFCKSKADEFLVLDLRDPAACMQAVGVVDFEEVYQLAADMGGMGFIDSQEVAVMRNNALINLNMIHAAAMYHVPSYFFSSSVCVYRDMEYGEPEMNEAGAYPASPDNEYGWEKLYAERTAIAYGRKFGFKVRIARFQNCYGPYGTWTGGREKAPAAFCRKIAMVKDGGSIEAWGDGKAVRSYIYIDDLVRGICQLMDSDLDGPVNIGSMEYVSVAQLIKLIMKLANKTVHVRWISGPVGVQSRNFSNERIYSLGWESWIPLRQGLLLTYQWVAQQVKKIQQQSYV